MKQLHPMSVPLLAIARKTGLSKATISRALRGSPLVTGETRAKVEAAAAKLGYQSTPLLGAVMANLRRASHASFTGSLAIVFVPGPSIQAPTGFTEQIVAGAKARAQSLGFGVELFDLHQAPMSGPALSRVLRARGKLGVILVHERRTRELDGFDWAQFPSVELDHSPARPALHTVCIDHHESFSQALERLASLGYSRAGMMIEQHKDERLRFKWSAAFRSYQETHGALGKVPVLSTPRLEEETFHQWFKKHKPDLLIGHRDATLGWLSKRNIRAPRDVGFFSLNWNDRTRPCAGLDLRPELQGEAAVESVVGQIYRHERGAPSDPRTIMVNARWNDGPTLRSAA